MGMKSAACWFSPKWEVRTSVIGEPIIRTIYFDIDNMIADDSYEVVIEESSGLNEQHFTEIILNDVFHTPVKRTIFKIKNIWQVYREFIRGKVLILKVNGEELTFKEPKILNAPYFKSTDEISLEWRKNISFTFGENIQVNGFAIRSVGSHQ